jgi:hypothetical protein
VVGSHARTRRKPEKEQGETIDLARLGNLKDTRPRCLLARLPLVETPDGWRPSPKTGIGMPGMLKQSDHGNALMKAMKNDPLLGPLHPHASQGRRRRHRGHRRLRRRASRSACAGPSIGRHAVLLEMFVSARSRPPPSRRRAVQAAAGDGGPGHSRPQAPRRRPADPRRADDVAQRSGGAVPLARLGERAAAGCDAGAPAPAERIFDLPFGRGVDHPEGWRCGATIRSW